MNERNLPHLLLALAFLLIHLLTRLGRVVVDRLDRPRAARCVADLRGSDPLEIDLSRCGLDADERNLPPGLFEVKHVRKLDLSGNALRDFDDDDGAAARVLNAPNLHASVEILFLSDNLFTRIPRALASFKKLSRLSFRNNRLAGPLDCAAFPDDVLVHVILTDNRLTEIGKTCDAAFKSVRKLMLTRNALEENTFNVTLPSLELVRLSENSFRALPETLISHSPHLKWISLGSNPCTEIPTSDPALIQPLPVIPMPLSCLTERDGGRDDGVEVGKKLGEGTSGKAIQCTMQDEEKKKVAVVIKRFNWGKKSSDGAFEYELGLLSRLPRHEQGLLRPIAIVREPGSGGRTAQRYAAAFEYVDAAPAGIAPDITTVVADRFPTPDDSSRVSLLLTPAQTYVALRTLICGLAALHATGIVHGDVYAHNTLLGTEVGGRGGVLAVTVDFGASTLISRLSPRESRAMLDADLRAYSQLVKDFLTHLTASSSSAGDARRTLEFLDATRGRAADPQRTGYDAPKLCTLMRKTEASLLG